MSKQEFKRVDLVLPHPTYTEAGVLTQYGLRTLLGRGEPVDSDWFIDVLGAAEIDLRGIGEALECVKVNGGLPISEVHRFATPKHGNTWDKMPGGVACRAQDYILKTLKKCGAVEFNKATRRWDVTPCLWVPE